MNINFLPKKLFLLFYFFKYFKFLGGSAISEQMVLKSENSLILTAPVMIPNFHDCDFDRGETPLSVDQISDFRRRFDDYGFVDRHHSIRGPNVTKDHLVGSVLKSFQLEKETSFEWVDGSIHSYPPGTWMLTSKITDPSAIKQVQNGEITGYSASVFNEKVANQIRNSLKSSEGDLIKDVKDPTVAVVSLVRKPCVSDARFCKCNKGDKMSEENAKSKLDSIAKILGLEKQEYASKSDVDGLKEELESYKEEIAETVDKAIKSALTEISIKEKKDEKEPKKDEKEDSEETGETEETEETEETKGSDEEKEEKKKEKPKGSAKGQKIHNNGNDKKAVKSDSAIVYDIMGRTYDGRPKKE